jgi:type II secretory pathway pseudopilin PulG
MRLVIVVMILLAFIVTFIALSLMLLVNRRGELFEEQRRETGRRAIEDKVRTFIKNKQRKYDSVKHPSDKNVEMCCICLDQFEEKGDDLVAQLDCNSKHVFHVKCLNEWIKNKCECPMCRDPIMK